MEFLRKTFYVFGMSLIFLVFTLVLFSMTVQAESIQLQSEPGTGDQYEVFVENLSGVTNLQQLQNQNLSQGESLIQPWSGSYWPIHKGILSQRYADPGTNTNKIFIQNYSEYLKRVPDDFVKTGQTEQLSPAEKYDLLVGDANWTLSKKMWKKGLKSFEDQGAVATWTGICHGWAAASHRLASVPSQSVSVTNVNGQQNIVFFASDIKGLVSNLWAASSPNTFRAGNRCRGNQIKKDVYLRPLEINCLDSNPKTWHLAVTNRIGIHRKSMVMDSSAGPEVWNYPLSGYDYHYFDPKTLKPTHQLQEAVRKISDLPRNHLSQFRSPQAEYLVGVIMDTFHPALTEPTRNEATKPLMSKKTYIYDLELNSFFQIVGGEWVSDETPDFIWTFPELREATTREDLALKLSDISWNSENSMPPEVSASAIKASGRGEVLSTIINELLNRSYVNTN